MLANPKSSLPPVEGEGEGPSWLDVETRRRVRSPDGSQGACRAGGFTAGLPEVCSLVGVCQDPGSHRKHWGCRRISLAYVCFYLPGTFPLPVSFSYELHSLGDANSVKVLTF